MSPSPPSLHPSLTAMKGAAQGLKPCAPASLSALERLLQPEFLKAACHEFYAAKEADSACLSGFVLGLATLSGGNRPLLWVHHERVSAKTGELYPLGVKELGVDPERLIILRANDAPSVLQAGLEGAHCPALGAVILTFWGENKAFDLTSSRRLALAAKASQLPILLIRMAALDQPSAAESRWRVASAPSRPLAANAPGLPAFSLTLLRHRAGLAPGTWHVEWNRDRQHFEPLNPALKTIAAPPLPRPLPPLSVLRTAEPDQAQLAFSRVG